MEQSERGIVDLGFHPDNKTDTPVADESAILHRTISVFSQPVSRLRISPPQEVPGAVECSEETDPSSCINDLAQPSPTATPNSEPHR